MIKRIIISYEPGYFSSFINLDNIVIDINSSSLSYKESYFDEVSEIEGHLSSWTKAIKANDFNSLIKIIASIRDIENEYEYYDSELTAISIYYSDDSVEEIKLYCNLNKNEALIPLVEVVERLVGKEYLLPSMIYVDGDLNEE